MLDAAKAAYLIKKDWITKQKDQSRRKLDYGKDYWY
jgi:hypothetical protein